jgi:PAS domain S-box-containing protein
MSASTRSALCLAGSGAAAGAAAVVAAGLAGGTPASASDVWPTAAVGLALVLAAAVLVFFVARRHFLQRDRALAAAEEHLRQLHLLVDGVVDHAVCLLDADGRVLAWNRGAERLTGWTAAEALRRPYAALHAPDAAAHGRPASALAEARRSGAVSTETQRLRKDGTSFWAAASLTALRSADGELAGFAEIVRDIGAEQQTRAALADSERLARALFEQTAVGIAQVAPDGRVLQVNDRFCELLGRSREEIGRSKFVDWSHPSDRESDLAALQRCAIGEIDRWQVERRYLRPDGRGVWTDLTLTLVRGAGDRPRCFIAVAQDITAAKAAGEALRASVEEYRLLFAANPLPMFVYDLDSLRILAVNEAVVSSYGYTREEFLTLTICDIRPPEDVPRLLEAVAAVRAGRHRVPVERAGLWRHRRADGSIIHVEISSHVVDFEGHRAELVLALDVTARLRAEESLDDSRARLSGIIESAMDAIITVDERQRIILFNRAAETMFCLPAGGALGKPLETLLPRRFREAHRGSIERFGRTGATTRRMGAPGGITGLRATGEEFPAEASISHVLTPTGSCFTVILRDITERRRAEDALAENRRRLQIAIESAHLGFWDWDVASDRVFFSPEWKRQLGYAEGEIGDDPAEYRRRIHPEDLAVFEQSRTSLLEGLHETRDLEFRLLHKDATWRDVRASIVLLRDGQGRAARIIGTNLDITPIREAERTVRRLSAHILRLQDVERRRIARELHDTTAQNLAALNMNLARLGRALAAEKSPHVALVDDTTGLADLCVQEVRTLSYLLHPPLLDEFGLARAIEDYANGFAARSGIAVEIAIDGALERLPDEVEMSFFRVLQESLGNVHKHSGSTRAEVVLWQTPTETTLEVRDAGRGIPVEQLARLRSRAALGVGVPGMTERIEQLGGRLVIESDPKGTVVRASVPRPAHAGPPGP